jgi:hypothetical protein
MVREDMMSSPGPLQSPLPSSSLSFPRGKISSEVSKGLQTLLFGILYPYPEPDLSFQQGEEQRPEKANPPKFVGMESNTDLRGRILNKTGKRKRIPKMLL